MGVFIAAVLALLFLVNGFVGAWSLIDAVTNAPTVVVFLGLAAIATLPGYLAFCFRRRERVSDKLAGVSAVFWAVILVPGGLRCHRPRHGS